MEQKKAYKFIPDHVTLARVITRQYEMGKISIAEYETAMDFLGVPVEERVGQEQELEPVPF